ncbi:hypothetical protein [Pyrobaculum sp.]|uniref:hypothetical protein n=1 Tax=Pyrobaculum sp. TaxID=2004705 RepID=UPI003D119DA3
MNTERKTEIERLVDEIVDGVIHWCWNVSPDPALDCLYYHSELDKFSDIMCAYASRREECEEIVDKLSDDEYKYMAQLYDSIMEEYIKEVEERFKELEELE